MLTFLSVTKQFGGSGFALKDLSFHLDDGDFLIIAGPSGSGKTTIMNLLIKDVIPTAGDIIYKGDSLKDLPGRKLPEHRRKIGVVFQDYRLLSDLNVWENIALPLSIIGKPESEIESRVTDLLNLVDLTDKALMFPKQLSGGEAQRVSIARALATGPSLIFADEPTGNLDKKSSLAIVKLLKQINNLGTTVIMATHDVVVLDELTNERIIELDHGVLKHDSQPKQAKVKPIETKEKAKVEVKEPKSEPEKKEVTKPIKDTAKSDKIKKETKDEDADLLADFTKEDTVKAETKKKVSFALPFFGGKKKVSNEPEKKEK